MENTCPKCGSLDWIRVAGKKVVDCCLVCNYTKPVKINWNFEN